MAEPNIIKESNFSYSERARNERIARMGRNPSLDWGINPNEGNVRLSNGQQVFSIKPNSVWTDKLDKDRYIVDDEYLLNRYGLSHVTLSKRNDVVTLSDFIVKEKGKGNGTKFMENLVDEADKKGWKLALTPSTSFGASSVSRLKEFYKRFGFKENKGRSMDYSVSESMIRFPKK